MTIAYDAVSDGYTSPIIPYTAGNQSWTHTPVGTPRGILVFIAQGFEAATDVITGVTYGGVAMTRVAVTTTAPTDPVRSYAYFLGSSIPTGAQTVAVTASSGTYKWSGHCVSMTAAADTEVQVSAAHMETLSANPFDWSGTLALSGATCFVAEIVSACENVPTNIAPLAGWSKLSSCDYGSESSALLTYDTVGSADLTYGVNGGASGDHSFIAVGVKEAASSGVSGSLSATESGSDTASIGGDVVVSGTASSTETGSDTAALDGDVLVAGSLAATETGADTAAFAAGSQIVGDLSATEAGADSAALGGDVLVQGSVAASESGSDTAAIAGDVFIVGALAATETGADTAALAGAVKLQGALAVAETGSDSAALAGDVLLLGQLAAFEVELDTAALIGLSERFGTLAATEDGLDTASFLRPPTPSTNAFSAKVSLTQRIEKPVSLTARIEKPVPLTRRSEKTGVIANRIVKGVSL